MFSSLATFLTDIYTPELDSLVTNTTVSSPNDPSPSVTPYSGHSHELGAPSGLGHLFQRYTNVLRLCDEELAHVLERRKVDPSFYLIRWWSTLFTTSIALPDVLGIWDEIVRHLGMVFAGSQSEGRRPEQVFWDQLIDASVALALVQNQRTKWSKSLFVSLPKWLNLFQNPMVDIDEWRLAMVQVRSQRAMMMASAENNDEPSPLDSSAIASSGSQRGKDSALTHDTSTHKTLSTLTTSDRESCATGKSLENQDIDPYYAQASSTSMNTEESKANDYFLSSLPSTSALSGAISSLDVPASMKLRWGDIDRSHFEFDPTSMQDKIHTAWKEVTEQAQGTSRKMAASDAAALFNKATSNLGARALALSGDLRQRVLQGADDLTRLKEELVDARPPSPVLDPFTPPKVNSRQRVPRTPDLSSESQGHFSSASSLTSLTSSRKFGGPVYKKSSLRPPVELDQVVKVNETSRTRPSGLNNESSSSRPSQVSGFGLGLGKSPGSSRGSSRPHQQTPDVGQTPTQKQFDRGDHHDHSSADDDGLASVTDRFDQLLGSVPSEPFSETVPCTRKMNKQADTSSPHSNENTSFRMETHAPVSSSLSNTGTYQEKPLPNPSKTDEATDNVVRHQLSDPPPRGSKTMAPTMSSSSSSSSSSASASASFSSASSSASLSSPSRSSAPFIPPLRTSSSTSLNSSQNHHATSLSSPPVNENESLNESRDMIPNLASMSFVSSSSSSGSGGPPLPPIPPVPTQKFMLRESGPMGPRPMSSHGKKTSSVSPSQTSVSSFASAPETSHSHKPSVISSPPRDASLSTRTRSPRSSISSHARRRMGFFSDDIEAPEVDPEVTEAMHYEGNNSIEASLPRDTLVNNHSFFSNSTASALQSPVEDARIGAWTGSLSPSREYYSGHQSKGSSISLATENASNDDVLVQQTSISRRSVQNKRRSDKSFGI